jgi:hypothetical protein
MIQDASSSTCTPGAEVRTKVCMVVSYKISVKHVCEDYGKEETNLHEPALRK